MEQPGSRMSGRLAQVFREIRTKAEADLADCYIDPDELRELRCRAARGEILKEENERFAKEKKRLKASNDRLSEELCERLTSNEDTNELVEDNKRLRQELEESCRQIQELEKAVVLSSGVRNSSLTPSIVEASSSATPQGSTGQSRKVAKEEFNKLVAKHNKLYIANKEVIAAKKEIEEVLRKRKKELHQWQNASGQKDAEIEKKKEKIQRQDEEIRKLRARVQELEQKPLAKHTVRENLVHLPGGGSQDYSQAAQRINGQPGSPKVPEDSQFGTHYFSFEKKTLFIEVPELVPRRPIFSAPPQLPVDFSTTRLLDGEPRSNRPHLRPITSAGESGRTCQEASQQQVFRIDEHIRRLNERTSTRGSIIPRSSPEHVLPRLQDRVVDSANAASDIENTQFVALEPESHHSSSTTESDISGSSPRGNIQRVYAPRAGNKNAVLESSESPEVVSCRTLKRKRETQNNTAESPAIAKIKLELPSSSPISMFGSRPLGSNSSMDLDEIGEKIDTPRKKRPVDIRSRVSRPSDQGPASSNERSHAHDSTTSGRALETLSTNTFTPKPKFLGRAGSALQDLSPNQRILPRTSDGRTSKKRRRDHSDKTIEDVAEDGDIIQKLLPNKSKPSPLRAEELKARLGGLLDRPSPEKKVLSPFRVPTVQKHQNHIATPGTSSARTNELKVTSNRVESNPPTVVRRSTLRAPGQINDDAIQVVADEHASSIRKETPVDQSMPNNKNNKSPAKRYTLKRKSPIGSRRASLSRNGDLKSSSEDIQALRTPLQTSSRPISLHTADRYTSKPPCPGSYEVNGLDDDPENEPFRARPVHRLGLEHFKINPAYNGGYDYAFVDVVRGKDDRRCLQGCTKPECCGDKFRALAAEMLHQPQTSSQEAEEQRLLDDYMGDNKNKLRTMTTEQRREVLLQAKTRELSNKYGRHRHAFPRSKTPPGFWDSDFPTTQEQVITREQQRQHERRLVEERYQEAMRPGGAFLFRDE